MAFWDGWFSKKNTAAPIAGSEVDLAKRIPVETAEQAGIRASQERLKQIGGDLSDRSTAFGLEETRFRGQPLPDVKPIPVEQVLRDEATGHSPLQNIDEGLRDRSTAFALRESKERGIGIQGQDEPIEVTLRREINQSGGGGESKKG